MKKEIAAGNYILNITAYNEIGKDILECSLEVKNPDARSAPAFYNRRDNYKFKMSASDTSFSVQLKTSGSTPITYSLEALSSRMKVPPEVEIDPDTGMLTVKGGIVGGIKAGTYSFIVKASNDVGTATKECFLEVTSSSLIPPPRHLSFMETENEDNSLNLLPLAVSKEPQSGQNPPTIILQPDLFKKDPPPNKLTLRCDDIKDVFTKDREAINGAYYICWDTRAVISLVDVMEDTSLAEVFDDYTFYDIVSWDDELIIRNNSPVCDRYHYYDPVSSPVTLPLTEEELAEIKANIMKEMENQISEYENGYKNVKQDLSASGLRDRYHDFTINPLDKTVSNLEYGSLLKEMNTKMEGKYQVSLNSDTGTVITGKYFTCLMANPKTSITFGQEGTSITFSGKDIIAANDSAMINIGYTYAPHELTMLECVGTGFESFTYGFQHHGELPGLATFTITSTLSEGSTVNVYQFDATSNQFILVAENLKVGAKGMVTYKNNTMSEYLITTKTIEEAIRSDIVFRQTSKLWTANKLIVTFIIFTVTIVVIGIILWLLLRKKPDSHRT